MAWAPLVGLNSRANPSRHPRSRRAPTGNAATSPRSIPGNFRSPLRPKEIWLDRWYGMQCENETGLTLMQREQTNTGCWEGQLALAGLHHLMVLSRDCLLNVKFSGRVRYHGHFSAGFIHFAPPDAQAHCRGFGPNKFMQISFTPCYLAAHLIALGVNADRVELRDVPSDTDIGLLHLAPSYEAPLSRALSALHLSSHSIPEP